MRPTNNVRMCCHFPFFLLIASAISLAACGRGIKEPSATSIAVGVGLIKVNQVGFLPSAKKLAVVPAVGTMSFSVLNAETKVAVLTADLSVAATWEPSEELVQLADFSTITAPGTYQIRVAGLTDSYPFTISADQYKALNHAAIKAYYHNRAGIQLTAQYAGAYSRLAGHADTNVLVHISAADAARSSGTVISSPKGWYDAGDYNKYIVNSGIATYTLLAAFEHFPDYYKTQALNIPESGDSVPDLLNEAQWNLDWMLTMQDPSDGGVYHKLTNKRFDGFVMPDQATKPRYVVQKTTSAALNFAAVMAAASRVYAGYETVFPGLSAKMLAAAERAWAWALANPTVYYVQPSDIKTGKYDDNNVSDEFAWAAAELYITTKNDRYYTSGNVALLTNTVPNWKDVRGLAWMSLAHHRSQLTAVADQTLITKRIDDLAKSLLATSQVSAYGVSMQLGDYVWGSNAVAANQAMMLIQGFRLNGNRAYLDAAQSLLDYVLGRNATDYSFVTGFGTKFTLKPHHRPSDADGVLAPVPGFLVGGPQPGQQDKKDCGSVAYPSVIAAKSYLNHVCSYASNEIAINWNAPLVYISGALLVLTK